MIECLSRTSRSPVETPTELKDPGREIVETVAFVIVLVFMLKMFLAEAIFIPTGSMATTLLGDHRDILCQQCRYPYAINSMTQPKRVPQPVKSSQCPNCSFENPQQ